MSGFKIDNSPKRQVKIKLYCTEIFGENELIPYILDICSSLAGYNRLPSTTSQYLLGASEDVQTATHSHFVGRLKTNKLVINTEENQ